MVEKKLHNTSKNIVIRGVLCVKYINDNTKYKAITCTSPISNVKYLHESTAVLSRQYSSTYMEVLQFGAVQIEIYAVVAKGKERSS